MLTFNHKILLSLINNTSKCLYLKSGNELTAVLIKEVDGHSIIFVHVILSIYSPVAWDASAFWILCLLFLTIVLWNTWSQSQASKSPSFSDSQN